MSSPKSAMSADIARRSGVEAQRAYDIGFEGLGHQQDLLGSAQAEPGYVRDAFTQQRAGLQEGLLGQGQGEVQAQLAAGQGAAQGGNTQMNLTPEMMGTKMAQALATSRVQEGLGSLEQANKLMQMRMGQSVQAGNAGLAAGGTALQNTSMLPGYNRTYANVLGGINAAGAIYGGIAGAQKPYQSQGLGGWDAYTRNAYGGPYQTAGLTDLGASQMGSQQAWGLWTGTGG